MGSFNMKQHKHANLIHAWADGAEIQFFNYMLNRWEDLESPAWDEISKYRIKPEPKPDYVQYINFHFNWGVTELTESPFNEANLKLTFDNESCKLKSAEVIK